MKKKLLKGLIALIAIVMPGFVYAQSQEVAGTYNGKLDVSLSGIPAGSSNENVYLTATDETHVTLEIKNFKFAVGGSVVEIGDITIPGVELEKSGNTIFLLPTETELTLPQPIGDVTVNLDKSTIINKVLSLTLKVQTVFPAPLTVDVAFNGENTGGSSIQNIASAKPMVYFNAALNSLIVKGAERQKYDIYNITGLHVKSGVITTEELNVSALSKGAYLIKVGNSTTKFIKK